MHRSLTSHRLFGLGLAVVAASLLLAGLGNAANKKTPNCADQVIADWYDDGRVGKIYPLECYRAAIDKLPTDVLDYSNAKEEISRALAFAKQGKPDPGGADPTPASTTSTSTTPGTTGATKTDTTRTTSGKTPTTRTDTTPTATGTSTSTTDTSGPSSVPIPLLVLGGLAILLLAAGSAGYLRRRMNGGDGTPPTAA